MPTRNSEISAAGSVRPLTDRINGGWHSARVSNPELAMFRRTIQSLPCALLIGLATLSAASGQPSRTAQAPITLSQDYWTVLTMAPDGAWGTATDFLMNQAIAGAIANCKTKSQSALGCGARYTTIQSGWSIALRCGGENILAAERSLAEAEHVATQRELDLRREHVPDMPPCMHVVIVDPNGIAIAPIPDDQVAGTLPSKPESR